MIKVFDIIKEFETYSAGGLKSGELCYVVEDKTAHFITNNIDGEDKTYDCQLQSALISLLQRNGTGTFIIPNGTKSIGGYSLAYSDYNEIIIPDSVTSLGDGAFYYCPNLTSITIPDSVTRFAKYVFENCSKLTSVKLPNNITSIREFTFHNCTSLTSVTIPDSVTGIGRGAFYNCTSLTSVTIPDSVTTIDTSAFDSCSSLISIEIPSGVTRINDYAFFGCSNLTTIEIPSGVSNIGREAFNGCSKLTSITVSATTPPSLSDNKVFNNTNNCPIYVPSESVETYKAATNWTTYATRIQAIS